MGRWEPDARGRLLRAAIDLFGKQGYDATTTAQIAERAGLTKTTFFRLFPDKREVLFFGQATLVELAVTAIAAAPPNEAPLDLVAAALQAMAMAHTDEQREYAPQLHAIVAANEELRERSTFKRTGIARAMAHAIRARGTDELAADLAAELGARAYATGFDRWIEPANTRALSDLQQTALDELRAAIKNLD